MKPFRNACEPYCICNQKALLPESLCVLANVFVSEIWTAHHITTIEIWVHHIIRSKHSSMLCMLNAFYTSSVLCPLILGEAVESLSFNDEFRIYSYPSALAIPGSMLAANGSLQPLNIVLNFLSWSRVYDSHASILLCWWPLLLPLVNLQQVLIFIMVKNAILAILLP